MPVYVMATDKRRDSRSYWEARLKRMHLDMEEGRDSWLSYGHEVTELDTDGVKTYKPTAEEIAERREWPISL